MFRRTGAPDQNRIRRPSILAIRALPRPPARPQLVEATINVLPEEVVWFVAPIGILDARRHDDFARRPTLV